MFCYSDDSMNIMSLLVFGLSWLAISYASARIVYPKITIQWPVLLLHIVGLSALGLVGETAIDFTYNAVFHSPLWQYHVYPIHHAYTSLYAIALWGVAGANLYFIREILRSKKVTSIHRQALIITIESWVFETVINVAFWLVFGDYIFYYLPSDLGHFTSIQVLPLYWLVSYIVLAVFHRFEKDPWFYVVFCMAIGWMIAVVVR